MGVIGVLTPMQLTSKAVDIEQRVAAIEQHLGLKRGAKAPAKPAPPSFPMETEQTTLVDAKPAIEEATTEKSPPLENPPSQT